MAHHQRTPPGDGRRAAPASAQARTCRQSSADGGFLWPGRPPLTAQLKALDLSADVDRTTARKKLDTCLANLEELRRTVEALKAGLGG